MSSLKYELEYDHVAYVEGKASTRMVVGNVLKYIDNNDGTYSIELEFGKDVPIQLQNAIEEEPRILLFMKVAKKSRNIIILP